jgi:regulator of protease activity HflC (stomatin/prohibitin superfamily)
MRKVIGMIFLLVAVTGCQRIEPGNVGIRVNMYGSEKGVEDYPLVTGITMYNPFTTSVFEYPTFVQTALWSSQGSETGTNEEMSFASKEGMVITSDVSLSYSLISAKVPSFYVKFRSDNLKTFTHGFLRNVARDAFNEVAVRFPVEGLYGSSKEEFLTAVKDRVNVSVKDYGVQIEQLGLVGAMRLPENVIGAINAKIKATQDAIKAENELRSTEAEAAKTVAAAEGAAKALVVRAEAEAAYNKKLGESITPALLTKLYYEKWDGKLPTMMLGEHGQTLIQVPTNK